VPKAKREILIQIRALEGCKKSKECLLANKTGPIKKINKKTLTVLVCLSHVDGGGAEKQIIGMLHAVKRNIQFHVVFIHGKKKPKNTKGIKFTQIKAESNYSLKIPLAVLKIVRQSKPNLIFSGSIQTDIVCGIISFICKVPWVSRYPSNPQFAHQKNKFKFIIQKSLYKVASLIICNSVQSLKYFKQKGLENLALLPNYIPDIFIRNTTYKLAPPYRFLCISRLVYNKNILSALALFNKILIKEKKSFTIVGSGPQKGELKAFVSSQKIKNVRFIEHRKQKSLKKFYNSHNILLFLSKSESFPNVVFESYLNNLKLILSDISAHQKNFKTANKLIVSAPSEFRSINKVNEFCMKPFVKNEKNKKKLLKMHNLTKVANQFACFLSARAKEY